MINWRCTCGSLLLWICCLCSVSHPSFCECQFETCDQEIWIGFGSVHPALKPQNMHMFPCRPVHDLTLSTPKELDVQTPILYAQAGPGRRAKRPSVSTLVALWSPLACPSCPFCQSSQKWGHGFLQITAFTNSRFVCFAQPCRKGRLVRPQLSLSPLQRIR